MRKLEMRKKLLLTRRGPRTNRLHAYFRMGEKAPNVR